MLQLAAMPTDTLSNLQFPFRRWGCLVDLSRGLHETVKHLHRTWLPESAQIMQVLPKREKKSSHSLEQDHLSPKIPRFFHPELGHRECAVGNSFIATCFYSCTTKESRKQIEGGKLFSKPETPYHKRTLHKSQPVKTVPKAKGDQKKILLLAKFIAFSCLQKSCGMIYIVVLSSAAYTKIGMMCIQLCGEKNSHKDW